MLKAIDDFEAERALIAAILVQAATDAVSRRKEDKPQQARDFIDKDNVLFCHYCWLLGINPEYAAKKMWQQIAKRRIKPDYKQRMHRRMSVV